MTTPTAPDRGNLIQLQFNPQAGHEQGGHRPAIVLSPKLFNQITGFAAVCPITTKKKGYGYEIELPDGLAFHGVILTDQVKCLDWRARKIQMKDQAPDEITDDCIAKIQTFLNFTDFYQ